MPGCKSLKDKISQFNSLIKLIAMWLGSEESQLKLYNKIYERYPGSLNRWG